eukprot:4171092-Amphidinium_carterae.1
MVDAVFGKPPGYTATCVGMEGDVTSDDQGDSIAALVQGVVDHFDQHLCVRVALETGIIERGRGTLICAAFNGSVWIRCYPLVSIVKRPNGPKPQRCRVADSMVAANADLFAGPKRAQLDESSTPLAHGVDVHMQVLNVGGLLGVFPECLRHSPDVVVLSETQLLAGDAKVASAVFEEK